MDVSVVNDLLASDMVQPGTERNNGHRNQIQLFTDMNSGTIHVYGLFGTVLMF